MRRTSPREGLWPRLGGTSRQDELRRLTEALDAFRALPGIEKARRLDAGDLIARFELGHTHDPRDQGHVVAGSIDDYQKGSVSHTEGATLTNPP